MKNAWATCVAQVNEWGHSYLLWLIFSTIKEIFVKWWFSTSSVNTPSSITVENSLLWQTNPTCHIKLAEVLFLFLMRLVGWQIPQCWMTASTVSAASDQNNSQRAFKDKTLGGDGVHMERNTRSMIAQTDGSDRVINKTAGKTACVCTCQSETFCLSSLLRTRPHSLAPVLLWLVSTGVWGCPDKFCWFSSRQQCCSKRSHTEFKFTSDTRISVIPEVSTEWYLRSERGEAGVKGTSGRWLHQLKSGFRNSPAEKKKCIQQLVFRCSR